MADIFVKYNNTRIFPTPLVNHAYDMIDLNNGRWGNVENLELNGYFTGITSTGDYKLLTNIFTGNFGSLTVSDGTTNFYSWSGVVVEDISFDSSQWPIGGFNKYKIKLKAFNFPSGVIDASNQYEFVQNPDGTVNVNHKISAKGVETTFGALDNAVNFVSLFTGQNPYNNCLPSFAPVGKGILFSLTENIDRLNQSYSVVETYKYNTGSLADYMSVQTLNIDESSTNDYLTLEYNIKYFASPITGNLDGVMALINSTNYITQLGNSFNINTSLLYQDKVTIVQDTGAATMELKYNFISGLGSDINGYFDFNLGLEQDDVETKQVWKIEGEYVSKGPLSLRQQNITNWKTNTITPSGGYETFLYNSILNSVFYQSFKNYFLNPVPITFSMDENTGLAVLKVSASFNTIPNPYNLISPKFEVTFEPSKWAFDLIPSANIEGHYVVQDLQMKTAPKASFNLTAGHSGIYDGVLANLNQSFKNLTDAYVASGFLLKQSLVTGVNEIETEYEYLGTSIPTSDNLTNYKVIGGFSVPYFRPGGFIFGY